MTKFTLLAYGHLIVPPIIINLVSDNLVDATYVAQQIIDNGLAGGNYKTFWICDEEKEGKDTLIVELKVSEVV